MARSSSQRSGLDARKRREYQRLAKQLENLPLLAQGSVFQLDPPADAPRASTRYAWTRKIKAKTVTRGLSKEEYEELKSAIEANRKVESALKRMREISQEAIVSPPRRTPKKKRRKTS